jgi:trk system potassium uptake protein TrkH
MNVKAIFNVVGLLLILLAAILIIPTGVALYYSHVPIEGHMSELNAFMLTSGLSGIVGFMLWKLLPSGIESLRDREGFAIVGFSWFFIALVGSLPFYLSGACPQFIDAFFEGMSGFTTTGASILTNIDSLPHAILFWRGMSQWLGGMGIIILSLAIFPALGIGSFHLFKAEIPGGSTVEKVQPRLTETAKMLWKTYVALTLLEIIFLRIGGMSFFDAICHTLSNVSTGGFSPHQSSIAFFNNTYFESVIMIFMFLGGINFALHYQLVRGNFRLVFQNPELKFYVSMILICIAIATLGLWSQIPGGDMGVALRKASFNVISINTTTGFATDDFNLWPDYLRILLLVIMMVGGCAGSTSGSLKAIRFIILFKVIFRELQKLVHPRAIIHVKVGKKTIEHDHLMNVIALTCLFMGISALSFFILCLLGVDITTSISASIASLFNIGPGLGQIGPAGSYADIPYLGKWIIIFSMLMGRLEIYAIMILFMPITWRK